MSYNIYPAKKLVKMAGHTFACNSVTSFLNGGEQSPDTKMLQVDFGKKS